MHTRGGKPINSCPHIWESVKHIIEANPNVVLDGELYNHELKSNFSQRLFFGKKSKNVDPEEIKESAELVEIHIYDMFDKNNHTKVY